MSKHYPVTLSSYCQLFTRDNIPSGNENLASLARPYFPTVWFTRLVAKGTQPFRPAVGKGSHSKQMAVTRISLQDLKEKYQLTEALLDTELSEEHLKEASKIIADHEILGTALGLSSAEMGQGKQPEIQRLEVFRRWKQKFVWKATYRKLIEALLNWNRADYAREIAVLLTQSKFKPAQSNRYTYTVAALPSISLVTAGASSEQPSACADHSTTIFTSPMSCHGATSADSRQHGVLNSCYSGTISWYRH